MKWERDELDPQTIYYCDDRYSYGEVYVSHNNGRFLATYYNHPEGENESHMCYSLAEGKSWVESKFN